MRFDPEAVQAAQAYGHTLLFREELPALNLASVLPEGKPLYLSINVDVLDPALLPATSSPEPDGLSFSEVVQIIQQVAQRNTPVGVDLVELTPHLDPSGTAH